MKPVLLPTAHGHVALWPTRVTAIEDLEPVSTPTGIRAACYVTHEARMLAAHAPGLAQPALVSCTVRVQLSASQVYTLLWPSPERSNRPSS